ncbi:MAG: hypothetical protein RL199_963 [Pseudomonadota bacterium]|jgi:UDPglucose--hexose-1-phosphate uridylyltransferase
MSEWRRSPVSGEWQVIAPERAHPEALRSGLPGRSAFASRCGWCAGPPGEERILYEERSSDGRWSLRVVPSPRPALRVEDGDASETRGRYRVASPGLGAHEVVVESPDHHRSLYEYAGVDFVRVLTAWRARMHDLARDRRLLVVVPRRIEPAGGRLGTHPCSELLALPRVPTNLERKLFVAAEHRRIEGSCLYCDLASEAGERLVAREGDSVAFVPWAAPSPFACRIVPVSHDSRFDRISDHRLAETARLLSLLVGRIGAVLERPRLTLWLHSAPLHEGERDDFHWHIELRPDLCGADDGWGEAAGVSVNPVAPETAARWLREDGHEGTTV